jgi:predicted metal-binding membrane protein
MSTALEAALSRHRTVSVVALISLMLIAWGWLLTGAGMEMKPLASLAPTAGGDSHALGMSMGRPTAWSVGHYALIFTMWWTMMVAMMLPSGAPVILLYGRVAKNAHAEAQPATALFLAGYLAAWGGFSLVATFLQYVLERIELLAPMLMASQSRWLSVALLISAGSYQLSPLKDVCLRHCRSPAQFLSSHYRPGLVGALRMGLLHGTYCIGCCWLLMALLFVGGVMNLAWIALLTLMVAAEKLLPFGRFLSIATGWACIVWGAVMLLG